MPDGASDADLEDDMEDVAEGVPEEEGDDVDEDGNLKVRAGSSWEAAGGRNDRA